MELSVEMIPPCAFDPLAPGFAENANEVFKQMRASAPVLRHGRDSWQFLSLFRYKDIAESLKRPEFWSSDMPEFRDLLLGDAAIMIQDDPPRHTHYRQLLSPFFAGREVKRMESDVQEAARALVYSALGEEIDFVEGFAARLAVWTICALLGIPSEEAGYIRAWTNRLSRNVGLEFLETDQVLLEDQKRRVREIHLEMTDYLVAMRSSLLGKKSSDGLMRHLASCGLSIEEQVGLAKSVAFAGNHTSAILLTNGVWLLDQNQDEYAKLVANQALVRGAVAEVLRHKATFRGVQRVAKRDGNVGGVIFNEGVYLLAWLTSGNFDEAVFRNAEQFDVERSPNRHLAFGLGPHYCIGSSIASLALFTVMRLLTTVAKVEVVAKPTRITDPWVDGFEQLRVKLTERQKVQSG